MMGIGWTEMLVIGVVALIFIGPKELPVVLGRVGKVVGQIQRMGREFQRELNKTTGLDEVRNLRTSITNPLKQTADEIRREFNAIGKDGKETPSGAIKPANPAVESVADEIREKAGMAPTRKTNDEIAAEAGFKPTRAAAETPAAAAAPVTKKAPAKPRAAAKPKAAATNVKAAKPAAPAKATPVAGESAAPAPVKPAKARAPRKPAVARDAAAAPAVEAVATPPKQAARKPRAPRSKPEDTAGKN